MPFDATPIRSALPGPAVRLCRRLGEIQVRLQASSTATERQALEAEIAQAISTLEMADAQAALLHQPHV